MMRPKVGTGRRQAVEPLGQDRARLLWRRHDPGCAFAPGEIAHLGDPDSQDGLRPALQPRPDHSDGSGSALFVKHDGGIVTSAALPGHHDIITPGNEMKGSAPRGVSIRRPGRRRGGAQGGLD
jgi:hypothetical protein